VINSSPGDLVPVFDAILEKAHSLCGAAYGSLQLYDGDEFRAVAVRGLSTPVADWLRQGYPAVGSANRSLLDGEPFAQIPDLTVSDDPLAQSGIALGGPRTILFVALRKEGILLGKIVAGRPDV